jgi:glycosyltransferase involved in cell wall biosynthesis
MKTLVSGWTDIDNIKVILNGTSLDKYTGYAPRPRENAVFNLAFVGRLTNWKGVDSVIRAVIDLPQIRFHIFGTGPEQDSLKKLAGNGNNIIFHSQVTGQKLRDALHTMQALILTSSYEGLSHTLIEACALGLPSITSNCGGNPEVIKDGHNGLVVPFDDVSAIRAAILKLADNEDYRFKLATNAKLVARDFDFNITVEKTIATLTESA